LAYLGHASIDDEIRPVYKTALVASKEEYSLRLLDSFAKTAGGEMDFTSVALRSVVPKPVLKQRRTVGKI